MQHIIFKINYNNRNINSRMDHATQQNPRGGAISELLNILTPIEKKLMVRQCQS